MKKVFKGIVLIGTLAGLVYAAKNLLGNDGSSTDEAQLTFADGSSTSLSTTEIQGQEFVDIARKLIESGV